MQANNPYTTGKHIWDENVDSLLGDLRSKGEEMLALSWKADSNSGHLEQGVTMSFH
jgi:hypothetical protein